MRLYAWQPRGHGEISFFVMANSEKEAIESVEEKIGKMKAEVEWFCDGCCRGWGTDYYELTVFDAGEVAYNNND